MVWKRSGLRRAGERQWIRKRLVGKTVKEVAGREWMVEVEGRVDLGSYREKRQQLSRAEYLKGFRKGDDVREEIKRRCEWGIHWE